MADDKVVQDIFGENATDDKSKDIFGENVEDKHNDIFGEKADDKLKDIFGEKADTSGEDLFADPIKTEEKKESNIVNTSEEMDLFAVAKEPLKEVEEPPKDKLFEEETACVSSDPIAKSQESLLPLSTPVQLSDHSLDSDLDSLAPEKAKSTDEEINLFADVKDPPKEVEVSPNVKDSVNHVNELPKEVEDTPEVIDPLAGAKESLEEIKVVPEVAKLFPDVEETPKELTELSEEKLSGGEIKEISLDKGTKTEVSDPLSTDAAQLLDDVIDLDMETETTKSTDEETDLFADAKEPPKEVEEPPEDKLFEEDTEIPLDNGTASEAAKPFSAPAQLPDHGIDFDLESPTFGKTKEEIEEEESGDTFDINIKISDPIKVGDGMNAYMAYSVTTQTSIPAFKSSYFSVKRRFSDFLGLHERLNEKHIVFGRIVPPPPDKSVVGMVKVKGSKDDQSSTDFVSRRKNALEKFLNRIAKHKVLLDDPDFKQFLEADELPRAKNTSALSKGGLSRLAKGIGEAVSKITSKMTECDPWFEEKQNKVEDLDRQIKKLHAATELLVSLKKEVSINTAAFAKSISLLSNSEEHPGLSRALSQLAELEEKIEHITNEQASTDFYLLSETLKEYIGLIASVKAAFAQRVKVWTNWQSAKTTLTKKRELLVTKELSGKMDKIDVAKEEVGEWERRVEKGEEEFESVSKSIKVEVAAFEEMRIKDFKELIISYLESLLGIEQQFAKLWEGFGPVAKSIC